MECVRLPPEIIRAIEKTISAGGTAKVRLVRGIVKVQAEEIRFVREAEARGDYLRAFIFYVSQ